MVVAIIILTILLVPIVWRWVVGIEYMDKNYPEYKGEDLFQDDEKDKTVS